MKQIHLIMIVYFILLFLPLIGGMISYRRNKTGPIFINQSKVKDPRYFAKSFTKIFFDKWANYDGSNHLFFSKDEKILLADHQTEYEAKCDSIVVAERHDFIPEGDIRFDKEIMAMQSAYIYGDTQIRAIRSLNNMIIGQGVKIVRWVDAEGHLFIRDYSDAGLSASSATLLNVGKNVRFKRMYAPVIHIAMSKISPYNHSDFKYSLVPIVDVRWNLETVSDRDIDASKIAAFSIVSKYDVKVLENIVLQGHIRSHKGIRLLDHAFVCGNIFAEEDIYIGKNVVILGNVFTHGNIYLENNIVIGQEHHISSIVSGGRIDFGLNIRVYGYVHSEKGGTVFNENLSQEEINNRITQEVRTYGISEDEKFKHLPHTRKEYNYEHPVGFRNDLNIKEITIPEGVEFIRRSMFFGCNNLEIITIPSSVKVIEDFAFYGCERLSVIKLAQTNSITKIGKSAFEDCTSLKEFELPRMVKTIESSAFAKCTSLEEFILPSDSHLVNVDSHAFKDCVNLKYFNGPKTVENIGISAFYGCTKLEKVNLSSSIQSIGEYAFYACANLVKSNFDAKSIDLIHNSKGSPKWDELQLGSN